MNEKEILLVILESLFERYQSLQEKLSLAEGKEEGSDYRYATLLHGQMKVVRAIQNCIVQLADPKKSFVTEREWRREFARMMEILAKEEVKEKKEHVPLMTHKGPQKFIKKISALKKS